MSHWAELDSNNTVTRVLVCSSDGDDGRQWLTDNFGGTWVQTSYSGSIRKNYAGIGFIYDEARDAFIPPQPFQSWVLDEETCRWVAPKPYPAGEKLYVWVEALLDWVEPITQSE